ALVSRGFQAEVQRNIYRTVSIGKPSISGTDLLERDCEHVLARPIICPFIEDLRISLPKSINQEAALRHLVTSLLQNLRNLSSLAFITPVAARGPSEIWTQCGTL